MYLNAKKIINIYLAILACMLSFIATPGYADTPVALYESLAGNINITGTAGTLRTAADGTNSCSVTNSGSMQLLGIPAGSTVVRAYLYWAGSGGDPSGGAAADYNVTFDGVNITADRTYTASYNNGGRILNFFNGVKDVTSMVTGNKSYSFTNLTVQNADVASPGGAYCTNSAVLSAFALVVVYSNPSETLHVVNIWEGLQSFRGAAISLVPTNFTVPTPVPATPLSSRHLVLTWEGDNGNSAALNGFSENLTFCAPAPCAGVALTDVYNPLNSQFNSTVDVPPSGPFSGIDTTWGVDLDMFDITSRLSAGISSAQAIYSSGGDLVLLSNQTMSIANIPVADLSITKSHSGNFTVGSNGVYTLNVTNYGPSSTSGTITMTDTLPAGLTYVSATGTGWTCSAVGQTVTCTRPGPLTNGASTPAITLTVSVAAAAYPSVINSASISSGAFDNVSGNDTDNDPTTVLAPNLATSTKTWLDLNSGDHNPGDTIRYTITLNETGGVAASGVSVTDNIPANVNAITLASIISFPAGATNSSTYTGTGTNGTGYLNITNITVPANSSVTVVFDVTVGAVGPGTPIDNTATITNPLGPGALPPAPQLIVSQSAIPLPGNKQLYLYGGVGSPYQMSRTPTPGTPTTAAIAAQGGTAVWNGNLPVPLQLNNTITAASANLYINGSSNNSRNVEVRLYCSSNAAAYAYWGPANLATNPPVPPTLPTAYNFPLTNLAGGFTFPATCNAGNYWVLQVFNRTATNGRTITVVPVSAGNRSQVILNSNNIIDVNSVIAYSAVWPSVAIPPFFSPGNTVFLRAVISDPFGNFDIDANPPATRPTIVIKDSNSNVVVPSTAMTEEILARTASTKTFQYSYTPVPPAGPGGFWTATVTASEGTEGTISDDGVGTVKVQLLPSITVVKSVQTYSDPINNTTSPKAIPGAYMTYTIQVVNSGLGVVDNNSTVITDIIPANTAICVTSACNNSNPPVTFSCSATPACGLTFNEAGDVSYSYQPAGGAPYVYPPTSPDGAGFDANVKEVRFNPKGVFNAASGGNNAIFNLMFKVIVK